MQSKTSPTHTIIYRDRPLRWHDVFIVFVPGGLAVLTPFAYGLYIYFYGPEAAKDWSWPWFALAAVALVPLLLLAIRRVRRAHRVVTLHKNGLIVHWTGGKRAVLAWEEIDAVAETKVRYTFLGFRLNFRHSLVLYPLTGKPVRIDDRVQNFDELAARIKARVYPRLLPGMRTMLQKGEPLHFGPVSLLQGRIRFQNQEIPWGKIISLNIDNGHLMVKSEISKPIMLATGDIPNVEILIQLLQEGVNV
ncbi:MAG: DUF6585 family protein [Chloroflexota bacterium]|nr:DUF6585 family protein [Chloroflexota bacterium]